MEAAEAAAGRMRRLFPVLLVLFASAAVAQDATAAGDLAGRFTRAFQSGDISGARYTVVDTAIIVATGPGTAFVELDLNFFNGHQCSIAGMATLENGRLVHRDAEMPNHEGAPCELSLWRDGGRLRWTDGEGSCRAFCGARGSLTDGEMRWSSRRAIPRAEQSRILREYEAVRNLP